MIVLDTDHISELHRIESKRRIKLVERLQQVGDRPWATTIVVEDWLS